MTKIVFIGAGSTVFAQTLATDILSYPELADITLSLHDIDPERLETTRIVTEKLAAQLDVHPNIQATTDRRSALAGADYAISMFQVGGYQPSTVIDFEIPKKYGLRQTIADTLGVGGIMRGLRTFPVMLEMLDLMEEVCPEVLHLNYVNPMAINVWAARRASPIVTVGLCHSVQHTAQELADDIHVPLDEINYVCAGINHMAFYMRCERKGPDGSEDLYPLIRNVIKENRIPEWNRVRYDIFKRFGYFVTESSEHFSEYVPWYIKNGRDDLIDAYNIPLDEYIRRCEEQIGNWEDLRKQLEDPDFVLDTRCSTEYAPRIIHSIETGNPRVVYGNVPNQGLIKNLPEDCVVEVPCVVDRNGIHPTVVGLIPPQLAALMQTNINVQSLAVEAALTGRREHIYQAAMLDPHTAAQLDLDHICEMVDELIMAHGEWLPVYQ